MAGIEVKGLTFAYAGASDAVLKGMDLSVKEGEFLSLIGPSGCGKSTLLRLLAGLEAPMSGTLICSGVPVTEPGSDRGVVFQNPALFPWMTAKKNVAFAIRKSHRSLDKTTVTAQAENALIRVGLKDSMNLLPAQLSGGMQQRVAMARALAMGCQTLLLDEPFSALDPKNRFALQELLLALWEEERKTVLFVTHDMDEAILLGDRVAFMEPGKIASRFKIPFPRPRHRETLLVSNECCALRRELISLFYKWGEAAEVNP